ncbi:MAG: metal ABC transporter ATP-binding protein [Gemmatimonadota bacterium]|nr:metal ABC transporter ATP-binding protein [Gemmatimonadota bacterium]MDE3128772.1 metal ABC transporter ATP-binding protein [Gemmatimonadota bacterium]MDE3172589.1 metal ABC transporter ATP-binding protein [Gemmatimonadota bacterium]MDE3215931.1 metal ABC transporter ATP-binding protein [Gemmatimonadota bacterium]
MTAALEVRNLSVTFGRDRVLRDLSFSVDAGKTLAIIGPNGAGKTVLFRALIGALPYEGEVVWAPGTRIGYVPQKLDIERDLPLTGYDFLGAKAHVTGDAPEEIARVLAAVSLDAEVAARPIGTLSGGQFQRLLVAFALMGRPTVLLFDEPTAGVDQPGEESIYALFRDLQRAHGFSLLLISHELTLVYRYADTVLCLSRSEACIGPPIEVLTTQRLQEMYGTEVKFHDHAHGNAGH